MSWELLRTDYTDATWEGLKKYTEVNNDDGTVSFQDVTIYAGKDKSFFGAKDANRMNAAMNIIMSMLEDGEDLYALFQEYFETQKGLFSENADAELEKFITYLTTLKTDTTAGIQQFTEQQKQFFEVWFEAIRNRLTGDTATALLDEMDRLEAKAEGFVNKTTVFSADGKTITETYGAAKRLITFHDDGSVTEQMVKDGAVIRSKKTTFSGDGLEIKEEIL